MTTDGEEKVHVRPPVAMVTGGTGAVGSVLVREFSRAGYQLVVPVRSSQSPHGETPAEVFYSTADLTNEAQTQAFVTAVLKRFGGIDVLLHAAGGFEGGEPLERVTVSDWHRMLQVNLDTAFVAIRSVLPTMRAQGRGRIICIAALAGMKAAPRYAAYGVSKRALIALVEAVAAELQGSSITCNALAPATIRTTANLRAMPDADPDQWVGPEEIASLCLFLASEAGGSVNGSILRLPGGK